MLELDTQQVVYWVLVTAVILAAPFLLVRDAARTALLDRLVTPALQHLRTPPEPDPLAEDLARALRIERMRTDLDRLRRLIATDARKSAVRQLGNRLAYEQLLREFAASRPPTLSWGDPGATTRPQPVRAAPRETALVEVLDITWRNRRSA